MDGEVVRSADLADESLAQVGRTFFTFRSSVPARGPRYVEAADLPGSGSGLATLSPAFEDLLLRARAVAASPVSVVLRGESGVGKEVLAHAIHAWSGRRGAFVPVNCGAIAQELVESELFGHLKGAFSGAVRDHPGLIRSSDGGTLFLDEVGDLPLPAQAALLRVLQQREVLPVGATRAHPVDLRLVAATHRDLPRMAAEGTFRHDLLARLEAVLIVLPPLREAGGRLALDREPLAPARRKPAGQAHAAGSPRQT